MARKAILTESTKRAREMVLDQSSHNQLNGLARSIADVQERPTSFNIAMIHSKHIEMMRQFLPELERMFDKPVHLVHLAMLEELYSWGVDIQWHMLTDQS